MRQKSDGSVKALDTIQAYKGVEVQLHSLYNSGLEGSGRILAFFSL
jgi:hypothetical protein